MTFMPNECNAFFKCFVFTHRPAWCVHVRMCVLRMCASCVYVCVYVCMYIYACVYACMCVCVCVYVCICMCVCIHVLVKGPWSWATYPGGEWRGEEWRG